MKKVVKFVLSVALLFGLAGCSGKTEEADTLGTKLLAEFKTEIAKSDDLYTVAETISAEDISGYSCMVNEIAEGDWMPGFTAEITGFTKGVVFMPMISSIPFVGYILESDDPEALKKSLTDAADPRWNICTEAAETVCEVVDGRVFFTMCPGEEE